MIHMGKKAFWVHALKQRDLEMMGELVEET